MFGDHCAHSRALQINANAISDDLSSITFMVDFEFKKLPDADTTIISICNPGQYTNTMGYTMTSRTEWETIGIDVTEHGTIKYNTRKNDGKHITKCVDTHIFEPENRLKPSIKYSLLIQHCNERVNIVVNGKKLRSVSTTDWLENPTPADWSSVMMLIDSSDQGSNIKGVRGFGKNNLRIHDCRIFDGCVEPNDIQHMDKESIVSM